MINQDIRWKYSKPNEDGEQMMILQYSFWDVEAGGYIWKDVTLVNNDGSPHTLDIEDEEDPY